MPDRLPERLPVTLPARDLRGAVLVTGTDSGVGKTVVTAAIAAAAGAAGLQVIVIKPAQTGGQRDTDEVVRLGGPQKAITLVEYADPMAPLLVARQAGQQPLQLYDVVDVVRDQVKDYDLVLVEGTGGLLVPMGERPSGAAWSMADLAVSVDATAVVVTGKGPGTLNHTALTMEALERRAVRAYTVIGAWPAQPEPVHWSTLAQLSEHLAGAVPEHVGAADPGVFRRSAPGWLTPVLYGVLDDWHAWAEEVG